MGANLDGFYVVRTRTRTWRFGACACTCLTGGPLVAATALAHGLTVATRNVADFGPMGVAEAAVDRQRAADEHDVALDAAVRDPLALLPAGVAVIVVARMKR